jgi:hypothetical protein
MAFSLVLFFLDGGGEKSIDESCFTKAGFTLLNNKSALILVSMMAIDE